MRMSPFCFKGFLISLQLLPLFLFLGLLGICNGQKSVPFAMTLSVNLAVDAASRVAEIDEDFVCATLDWWPGQKCDYGRCSWVNGSVLNLDLQHPAFLKAIKAFSPLKIRLGGTLQDKLLYDVGPLSQPCHDFTRSPSLMFGFTKGCLSMQKWDEINKFLKQTGAVAAFGLNALYGRYQVTKDGLWGGPWDSTNARSFIQYTVDHGYEIQAWEFGNELSGSGIGARVNAKQYVEDVKELASILKEIYRKSSKKPLLIAPDGFYDLSWFKTLLQGTGRNVLNAVTRHVYNLGAGVDKNLKKKILNPAFLDKEVTKYKKMQSLLKRYGPWASSWVGEAGGAYNSGKHLVSDAFVNSFWYLDQLGMASKYNTKVYCRQSLVGGNYALLNTTTFAPNPDYYSALLWHRLMGRDALNISSARPSHLRAYAHCAKNDTGITLLLINLSNTTKIEVSVSANPNVTIEKEGTSLKSFLTHHLKKIFSWAGSRTSEIKDYRMEYHLTPKDGDLQSQEVLLNGSVLKVNREGDIPQFVPHMVDAGLPIAVSPMSILFVSLPAFEIPACKKV